MAAPVGSDDVEDIFAKLQRADPSDIEARNRAINDRLHATFQKSQQRLADLIDENSTLPTTISSITVLGAPNTRRSFLARILDPLLTSKRDRPYTQSELVSEVAGAARKLSRFGMFDCSTSLSYSANMRHRHIP